jgi:CRP/FNR family cyclic AMP-dependent transcriptional regulator
MEGRSELVDNLARLSLFADLSRPELEKLAHSVDEEVFPDGQRVLRQGLTGAGFFVILDGKASIRVDGEDRWTLGPGDFFGETSLLTGDPPTADVVATSMLRVAVVPGPELEAFLLERPRLMLRLLRTEAQRLRAALEWRQ